MSNNHSFIAYIDESGDTALNKKGDKAGASKWFVLSALIVRASRDIELPKAKKEIMKKAGIFAQNLHMHKIPNQEKKLFIAKEVSQIPSRCISVISNKNSIINAKRKDLFDPKNSYYNYMSRYLIERISWCCSDLRSGVPEGNGKVKIIFSKRGGMSYSAFRDYLNKLKQDKNFNINWNVIDIDAIDAMAHSERTGLQLVDVVAFSFFKAVEKNNFNMTDCSLAKMFRKNIFNKNGKYLGYGLKIMPNIEKLDSENLPTELIEHFKNK